MQEIIAGTESIREESISLILDTPKTGRLYSRRGHVHQASAPGEAPASDTGDLVGSITTAYDHAQLRGRVLARSQHANYLEFGTQNMAPRPFLRPALSNKLPEIHDGFQNLVARVNARTRSGAT
jgi:HK97 gp10 family phage protein